MSGRNTRTWTPAGAVVLALLVGGAAARAQPGGGNLPIFTSPIDVTGLKLLLVASAPDRDSGRRVDVALPAGLGGPGLNQLTATPLSTQIDQYWNGAPDPTTGMNARQSACDGPDGIKQQVGKAVTKIGSGYSAYDVSCNLASKGQLVAKQVGSVLYLGYLLTGNTVSFASTSPGTCNANHGTPFCPNDPRFTVHFATEIVTVLHAPSLCAITAEDGTVFVPAASIESRNAAASIGRFFGGQKFVAGEVAITNTVRAQPLPIDGLLKGLRTSDACTGRVPAVSRLLTAFRELDVEIAPRQGIVLRAIHAGITAPVLEAPNPGFTGPVPPPNVPSFTRPTISTAQPLVTAGNAVQVTGQHFPPVRNLATALPVTFRHGGFGPNSVILGGVCFGGATELDWGQVGRPSHVQRFPGDAQGACVPEFEASGLTPATGYQFRARDCDPVTCSPWSVLLRVTTARADANAGAVVLTLDGGAQVGAGTVDGQGGFVAAATIPAGTPAGAHVLHATDGDAKADVTLQVAAPGAVARASITMVGVLNGERGCPNHPIASTVTDNTFMLFGAGFAPGSTTIRLDTAAGSVLGTAAVGGDGTICQQLRSPPAAEAGPHTLVAVQGGTTVAQAQVTFVLPIVVR